VSLRGALLGAVLVCTALPSRSAIVEMAFDTQGRFAHETAVPPGKFVEVCGKLPRGARIAWKFEAHAPLDFNVHYHIGDKVEFPEKRTAVSVLRGDLVAASDQHYCWMWKNNTASGTALAVQLLRE
jgi:hypothetical protein